MPFIERSSASSTRSASSPPPARAPLSASLSPHATRFGLLAVGGAVGAVLAPAARVGCERHGVAAPVVGRTPGQAGTPSLAPEKPFASRAAEIEAYLAAQASGRPSEPPPRFVILDDRPDAGASDALRRHFVRTDPAVGLTDADVDAAVAIVLGAPRPLSELPDAALLALLTALAPREAPSLLTASLAHWRMDYEATLVSAGQRDLKRQMRALQKEAAEALKQERHSAFVTRQALHARIKELEEQIRNLFGAQVVEPAAPPPPPDPVMIVFHSISAKGIPNADAGGGSDPYARFTIIDDFTANKPGKNQIGYTSYIQNELDPNWAGERLQLDLTPGGDRPIRLRVEVWDKDVQTPDDVVATCDVALDQGSEGEHEYLAQGHWQGGGRPRVPLLVLVARGAGAGPAYQKGVARES